jgi:hypothetical protein
MNKLFATGRTRCVIVDDETWEAAREAAQAMSVTRGQRVTISMLVRESIRDHWAVKNPKISH